MKMQRRGRKVALLGAVLQAALVTVMVVIWLWTSSRAAMSCAWLTAGGLGLWLMVALLFYGRELEKREQAELEEVAAEGAAAGTVFEGEDLGEHRLAARRRAFLERRVVPSFTLLWAAYHAAVCYYMLRHLGGPAGPVTNPGPATLFTIIIGFVAFLFSAYAIGMSHEPAWRLLRPPGSYLLVNVLMMAGVLAALVAAWQQVGVVDRVVAYVIPVVQLVVAAELVINFVLELYRPRVPGREVRLSFDSRLLSLMAEPQRLGRSIAETLNYQFGFEVSKTWFYQLLGKAFLPLVVFGVAVMFLMSSLVLVDEGQQCVVMRWGRLDPAGGVLGPGLHFKLPWPVDTARHFDTRVRSLSMGTGAERLVRHDVVRVGTFTGRELALWTEEHGRYQERDFLLGAPPRVMKLLEQRRDVPAVNIVRLIGFLQYRVTDPYKFGFRFRQPEKVLEALVHQEMVRYCSSATLYQPATGGKAGSDRPEAIMTYGRQRMAEQLQKRVQAAVNRPDVDLGVEILALNFQAVHPPPEAAPAFEEVLAARLGRAIHRFQAEADANRLYYDAAGAPLLAQQLALALTMQGDLTGLQTARGRDRNFDRQLANYIDLVRARMAAVDEEVQRETLLGKLRGGERTTALEMREVLRDYLQQLQRIRDDRAAGRDVDLTEPIRSAAAEVDRRVRQVTGRAAVLEAQARADRWGLEMREWGRAEMFPAQVQAYGAAPRVFMLDRYLDVWDQVLPTMPKYLIGIDPARIEPWLNLERQRDWRETIEFGTEEP